MTNSWSPENRLLEYASGGTTESYQYSQDGLRKQKANNSGTILFTWDEQDVLLETNTSNVVQARYTDSPETWGGLASQNRSGVTSYYGLDSQQSERILVSSSGAITDSYSWKVFGEPIQTGSGTVNPYGYVANALYYTELVDLINAWNRWLQASVGRWDSRDPFGMLDGWNPYKAVLNNPNAWMDPSGTIHSFCGDTKPGSTPGQSPEPWKVIPDPEDPFRRLPDGRYQFCFIIVDQFCDPYCNPDAGVSEDVHSIGLVPFPTGPDAGWIQLHHGANPQAAPYSPPQFCDIMGGVPGTSIHQCYSVRRQIAVDYWVVTVLEPCPFTVQYGPNGPVRTYQDNNGKTVRWGSGSIIPAAGASAARSVQQAL